ncbi:alpha/beta fold hydrolase [Gordonia sp. CPCC 205515]|uniref:alpha/beta fold hydrolase n=1 Tax=Gordonia sp. CPCC 205515 TaxID=3140791 RepID=UPI003AF3ED1F
MVRIGGRPRWPVAVTVLALLTTVVVGCAGPSEPDGPFAWHPCGADDGVDVSGLDSFESNRLRCGRLAVPLDPADPALGTVTLAIARLSASVRRTGTLVVDPGGPGVSAAAHVVRTAPRLLSQSISATTDIVGIDWRGVGASRPSVRCRTDGERDAERAMDLGDRTPAGIVRIENYYRHLATQCRDRVGAALLGRVGTDFVADDLDQVRIALGEDTIDFLGHSYGTRVGITYARRHPQHVRSLVLDGVVDPDEDPMTATIEQYGAFQHALDAFSVDCAGYPACPLGDRPGSATARYRSLVDPLVARPVPVGARVLDAVDAKTGTLSALYGQDRWPRLRSALTQVTGGSGEALLALADDMEGRATNGRYTGQMDSYRAVRCADDIRITDRRRHDDLDTRVRQVAPFTDDGRGTGHGPIGVCEFWPQAQRAQPPTRIATPMPPTPMPPTLMVSTLGDPATPHATALRLADALGVGLLSVRGVNHTAVFHGDDCVDDAVNTFLTHPTRATDRLTC